MQTQYGAEATITFLPDRVVKERAVKGYRNAELDQRLRVQRTKREATMLAKAPVRVPKVLLVDKTIIEMECIGGERLRDCLNSEDAAVHFGTLLGNMIHALHGVDIMHGDLTTSNVMVETASQELVLIDFGLAQLTKRIEDKAVDLHVLRETLEGSHPLLAEIFWNAFSKAYTQGAADNSVIARLTAVEARGRHKVSQ